MSKPNNGGNKAPSKGGNRKPKQRRSNGYKPAPQSNKDDFKQEVDMNRAEAPHVVTASKGPNDVSWYKNIPTISKDFANVWMSNVSGLTYNPFADANFKTSTWAPGSNGTYIYTMPGIMKLNVVPSIGVCTTATDAANIAAEQLYNLIRKENSGARNYSKTDVMGIVLAMDNAYMLYEYLIRLYRTLGEYKWETRYLPDCLVSMMGFDVDNLRTNYAALRGMLDLFAYRLASINIPDEFDIIRRHSWLFSNIYKDGNTSRAQLYYFDMAGLYIWNEANITDNNLNILKYTTKQELFGSSNATIDNIQQAIERVMRPIMGSNDLGDISGDIAKAFPHSNMIQFKPAEQYTTLEPVYVPEVLTEIENATYFSTSNWQNLDIKYAVSDLNSGEYFTWDPYCPVIGENFLQHTVKNLLNFHTDEVSSDDVLVATRFSAHLGYDEKNGRFKFDAVGTEFITGVEVGYLHYDNNGAASTLRVQMHQVFDPAEISTPADQIVPAWCMFDWAPTMFLASIDMTSSPLTVGFDGIMCDIDNYVWLDPDTLKNIHLSAIMSLFAAHSYPTNM
nr:putative capsid [Marmot picobirnavirus]